jgi:hypothetical protein
VRVQQQSTVNASTSLVPADTTSVNQASSIVTDIKNLTLAVNGNLRIGSAVSGQNGENISGQWLTFTSGTAGVFSALTHTVGAIPVGFLVTNINKPAIVYSSGTSWTGTTVYLASNTTGLTATVFLLR